ncbi:MAG: Transaldolase [Chlamydiales bacterium]|nr:Transaldolase [Chlamydiales bacterium]MCH9619490.1 Transaldolase [Chlamydiales bacterium]MCH9622294.1 Transaldolase [Chlamydiales bacterium]
MKVFADGATLPELLIYQWVDGVTTNPSLMKQAGVKDYASFCREMVSLFPDKPISFEVFADEFYEMEAQAYEIASWGSNVYVKIPVMNTQKVSSAPLIEKLSAAGIQVNVTAVFTLEQAREVTAVLSDKTPSILSYFAGRVADTGRDAALLVEQIAQEIKGRETIELLWASTRELYNFVQAKKAGCHIITAPPALLKKRHLFGKDLEIYSQETVEMFYLAAEEAGYQIETKVGHL